MKSKKPKFSAAAAFAAQPDDGTMGQGAGAPADPSQGSGEPDADDSSGAASGQPLSFPPEQVAQMEQLKQSGDMQSLGQYVAQYLP